MDKLLLQIKSGIESYKKVFPKKYQFIKSFVDPVTFSIAIAKIESNFNYKARGRAGEYGLYQFTPGTLYRTIRSYTRNVSASKKVFYRYPNSQTFVLMQLLYLNLKVLNNKGGKLNKDYEKVIAKLPINDRNLVKSAILHNQGSSAITRQATHYNPLVFYIPQFLGALKIIKGKLRTNSNIASVAVANGIWQAVSLAFPELRAVGILGRLALIGVVAYMAYNMEVKTSLPKIINDTNLSYRQMLKDRFKIIWLAKGSEAAKQIDEDMKDEDHPLVNEPSSGNKKPPTKKPGKKWPKPSAGDVGKVIITTGAAKAVSDVGDGAEKAMDNLSKSVGSAVEDIPKKVSSLLSNPMFLGAAIGIFYLVTKKK